MSTPPSVHSIYSGTSSSAIAQWVTALVQGDRNALSQAITCVEGTDRANRLCAQALLSATLAASMELKRQALRIGITGPPGVGKSTLIEAWGRHVLNTSGHKVAVLAVDPTSPKSKGSILGDKTRMTELSQAENAYVRPSPSGLHPGGVALASADAISLCEAAGYDVIFVETVGVGQGATSIRHMVDVGVLLLLSGVGDDIQAIKKGILEIADILVVHKVDTTDSSTAKAWGTRLGHIINKPVWAVSSKTQQGIAPLCQHVDAYWHKNKAQCLTQRQSKREALVWEWVSAYIKEHIARMQTQNKNEADALMQAIQTKTQSPREVAQKLINSYILNTQTATP